jgi:hypothetical protein
MTRGQRREFVRQAILSDVWAGESGSLEDGTVWKIVDRWEQDIDDAFSRGQHSIEEAQ